MFRSKIVFVLGAGSSAEVNMPTGEQLKDKIINKLNFRADEWAYKLSSGDQRIYSAIMSYAQSKGERTIDSYLEGCKKIRNSLEVALSIDNVLATHKDHPTTQLMGKVGIVSSILDAERSSKLFVDPDDSTSKIDFKSLDKTWFNPFFKMLSEEVERKQCSNLFNNVSFINFNYDRCLEQYLYQAILKYYDLSNQEAEELISSATVYRPYGSLGKVSWVNNNNQTNCAFGADRYNLLNIAAKIKTFNEQLEESDDLVSMRNAIAEAEIIVFLGFAFHRQNLNLIKPTQTCAQKKVYGTSKGFSQPDNLVLRGELHTFFNQQVTFNNTNVFLRTDLECSKFMSEYWRSLTTNL